MQSVHDVLEKLLVGQFDALIGLAESEWLEAKQSPYLLDTTKQKLELAKDVSALANAVGGVLVLGFDTVRDPLTATEHISAVNEFPLSMLDPDRYRKLIQEYVYPHIEVEINLCPSANGKGVAAIVVSAGGLKPYIVGKMTDDAGQTIGAYFGFFERRRDIIPPVSVARIQQHLSAGQQWSSVDERLSGIEAVLKTSTRAMAPANTGISEKERNARLAAARKAVDREEDPLVCYVASALGPCDFPTLFLSHSERLVRFIEKPPSLRRDGFNIWASNHSEIIDAKFRRSIIDKVRLIELWKDGMFLFMAPGDEDFLGWRMQGSDRPIRVNNFVLAESILQFCWIAGILFLESDPRPGALKVSVAAANLTRPAGAATLSSAREAAMPIPGQARQAPQSSFEVSKTVDLEQYDPEELAGTLFADIYNWFGFNAIDAPYIDWNGPTPRLPAQSISGAALPDPHEVPTPGY